MTGYKVPKSLIEEKRASTTADLIESIESLGEEELNGWQRGLPLEDGLYIVAYTWAKNINYAIATCSNGQAYCPHYKFVIAHQKITPYKEG